jgi:hypothetical protein
MDTCVPHIFHEKVRPLGQEACLEMVGERQDLGMVVGIFNLHFMYMLPWANARVLSFLGVVSVTVVLSVLTV